MNTNRETGGGPDPESIEEDPDGLTPEQRAYAEGMLDLPQNQKQELPGEKKEKHEQVFLELGQMVKDFKMYHSLPALRLIRNLTVLEAPKHRVREPARKALIPITEKLNYIKNKTDISAEKLSEIEKEYRQLWRAVGVSRGDKIIHD